MAHYVTSPCVDVKDQSCMQVCPVECIYDLGRNAVIARDECIDCGACVPACPVDAIVHELALTPLTRPFAEANAARWPS